MSVFVCDQCGSIEELELVLTADTVAPGAKLLCSACLPVGVSVGGLRPGTGKWHGHFPRRQYNPEQDLPINRSGGMDMGVF